MSTLKCTDRKKNFANPSGSLVDPSAHIQTDKITLLYRDCNMYRYTLRVVKMFSLYECICRVMYICISQ